MYFNCYISFVWTETKTKTWTNLFALMMPSILDLTVLMTSCRLKKNKNTFCSQSKIPCFIKYLCLPLFCFLCMDVFKINNNFYVIFYSSHNPMHVYMWQILITSHYGKENSVFKPTVVHQVRACFLPPFHSMKK